MEVKYKRIVLKLSGEALAGDSGFGFDNNIISKVVEQIIEIKNMGIEIALVIGAGNFWRGRQGLDMNKVTADQMGMVATVLNALAVSDALEKRGVKTSVQTALGIEAIGERYNTKRSIEYLKEGRVLLLACGTGNPFCSTDSGASLRAIELEADALLCAKNVDAVYDSDPRKNPNAKKLSQITHKEVIAKDIKALDTQAHVLCMENDMTILVFGLDEKDSIKRVVCGENIGTIITN